MKEQEKMHLPKVSVDDFFTSQKEREDNKKEKVEKIPLELIDNSKNNPFKVRDDAEMRRTIKSIEEVRTNLPCYCKTNRKWQI